MKLVKILFSVTRNALWNRSNILVKARVYHITYHEYIVKTRHAKNIISRSMTNAYNIVICKPQTQHTFY